MRLECPACVVRDWTPSDKGALVRVSRTSVLKDGELIDRVVYALVDRGGIEHSE